MFVQVIQGKVKDPEQVRAALDRWVEELAPDAPGWLGSTSGVTEDGTFITLARFASEDEARRNSDRPEQGAWWTEMAKLYDGEVSFSDSVDVDVDMPGDPDTAGFVQIIRSRTTNPDRMRELMREGPDDWREYRPDLIGTLTAVDSDGGLTTAAYFTSEAEAREGEAKEMPPEMQAAMSEVVELSVGEPTYLDLRQPWLHSPRAVRA